ncbi:MAG: AMP-binding protein, partial [Actinoallomurus sp.]
MTTVWEVFEAQARHRPAAVAIRGAEELSYGELAGHAEELARKLLARTRPGTLVALEATGTAAGTIAFLAAAKAGCPILPLSPDSPPRHRAGILSRARPGLLLREQPGPSFAIEPVTLDDPGPGQDPAAPWPPGLAQAAYVMFTSGSTGKPKGVVVSHDALLCRLRGMARRPGFGEQDSFLAMTALSFDPCLAELLMPLVVGGQIVAAPPTARLDPEIFAETVRAGRPSVIQATPSFWRLALTSGWTGAPDSTLWCGGEALTPGLAARLLPVSAGLWNVYGPTETTVWSCAAHVTSPESIGLGRPLDGTGLALAATDADD